MVENLEVEVKVLEKNHKDLEEKIFSVGGVKTLDSQLVALRLDIDGKYIFGSSQFLRIRSEGDIVKITHKLKQSKNESTNSYETEIDSPNSVYDIYNLFKKLGYYLIEETIKQRISYKINFEDRNFVKFDFDKYKKELDFIPEFVEIESDNYENILRGAKLIGIFENEFTTKNLGDLKLQYERI